MAEAPRRFPPPWRTEPIPGGYVVRDASEQATEALQANMLTEDEARRVTVTISRVPELLGKADRESTAR
jgi:hypothetical protein